MSTVNCASCRWWDEIGLGFGFCVLTRSTNDAPKYCSTRAMVRIDGGIGSAQLVTDHRFTRSQFSRSEVGTARRAVHEEPDGARGASALPTT